MTVLRKDPVVIVDPNPDRLLRIGELEVDVAAMSVSVSGVRVDMPLREFQVLLLLADNAGRVLSHSSLVEHLWHPDFEDTHGNLKLHVSRLRHRMRAAGAADCIRTVRGVGYCLEAT